MNYRAGERYRYTDGGQDAILEIVRPSSTDAYYFVQVVQRMKGSLSVGESCCWSVNYGTWTLLTGQDKP